MSNPCLAIADPLLQEVVPRSANHGRATYVLLALVAGFGCAAFLSKLVISSDSRAAQEPTIDMAWQSMQASSRPMLIAQATPFVQQGFEPRSSVTRALTGSGVADVRHILRSSPVQKCVYADKYASLCGNVVVLRPSTAVRATTDKESVSVDADEIIKGVSEKIDAIEDKPGAVLKAGAAVVAIVIANSIVTSIEAIPLIPKLLELVGTGYSGWFTYRYLLKKESRTELIADIESVKEKILG